MEDIVIENIVAYAQIADSIDIEQIAEKIPELLYNPEEFPGLTLKLDQPKTAILLLPSGKAICTGAKKIEDAENAIKKLVNKIKGKKIKIKNKLKVETQNIVASIDIKKDLIIRLRRRNFLMIDLMYSGKKFHYSLP